MEGLVMSNDSIQSQPLMNRKRQIISSLVFFSGVLVFSAYYFRLPDTARQYLGLVGKFYPKLNQNMYVYSGKRLEEKLSGGTLSDWDLYVIRPALVRWRLKSLSKSPFDHLMEDYESGLWIAPDKKQWEHAFRELDSSWRRRRFQSLALKKQFQSPQVGDSALGLTFVFREQPLTAGLGSLVQMTIVSKVENKLNKSPQLYWELKSGGISGSRCMLGNIVSELEGKNGEMTYFMEFDFSSEPHWLAPKAQLTKMTLSTSELQVTQLQFSDSPLLPLIFIGN
jgi:hypothetical protein